VEDVELGGVPLDVSDVELSVTAGVVVRKVREVLVIAVDSLVVERVSVAIAEIPDVEKAEVEEREVVP
jgi:D-ribose pyranose/furanose isomerase RbsD